MSNIFLIGIYLLIAGNLCVATAVIVFLTLLLKRQKQGFKYISSQLFQIEKEIKNQKNESSTRVFSSETAGSSN